MSENVTLDEERCWESVLSRESAADGAFVYAVASTRIYCRPSCSSKKPKRENVAFFAFPAAAQQAGYRPCKRCRPDTVEMRDDRARTVQAVADYLSQHAGDWEEIALARLGENFGYDPQHIQRMFRDALGLTPRQYAEGLRAEQFRLNLREGRTVLDAGLNAGYGSATRTYESGAQALGMTPAVYRQGAAGVKIGYAVLETTLGVVMAAATPKGVCMVGLYDTHEEAEMALREEFSQADCAVDETLHEAIRQIVAHITFGSALDLPLDIQATAFQQRVWRALRAIPRGETRSYTEIAEAIGVPNAVRAVASACAANPVAVIIPCHRVLRNDGSISGYRWGPARKQRILTAERD